MLIPSLSRRCAVKTMGRTVDFGAGLQVYIGADDMGS